MMDETISTEKILTFKEKAVLDQIKQHHRDTVAEFSILDGKASAVISVSSIIITIITGFKLAGSQNTNAGNIWPIFLLYIVTLVFALMALLPRDAYHEPIKPHWDDIRDALKTNDDDFFYRLLSGYELSITRNLEINSNKARFVSISFISLGVTVIVALLIAMI